MSGISVDQGASDANEVKRSSWGLARLFIPS